MRNIARINNYYNRQAAWEDWRTVVAQAVAAGQADLVAQYQPDEDAGWQTIDRQRKKLEFALVQQKLALFQEDTCRAQND